jgi:hypothetical protein
MMQLKTSFDDEKLYFEAENCIFDDEKLYFLLFMI